MKKIDPVLQAIKNRHNAILVSGNNIFDLQIEPGDVDNIYFRPFYVAEKLYQQGYLILRYSRSTGLRIYKYNQIDKKKEINSLLQKSGLSKYLNNQEVSPSEVVEIFRGIKSLAIKNNTIPIVFIIDYLPHLISDQSPDNEEKIVSETINDISSLPTFKKSKNILILYSHKEHPSPLLNNIYNVNYGYPTLEEYRQFVSIIQKRQDEYAKSDIDPQEIAKLSRGLTLTQIANIFKEAKARGLKVTREAILHEKERLIEHISGKTLNVLSTDLTFDDMAGLKVTKKVLNGFANKLSKHDPSSPRAILLAGPPGTGKTTIVSAFANACGFNLVEFSDEIKSKWVGESEARLNLALQLIESLSPVILFIDEIDQAFSKRSEARLDGGVSSHYLKTIFKFAARDDLRGKICIVGSSNTPQLLDPAMINRFITIPLLEATPEQMVYIFPKIEKRIIGKEKLKPNNLYLKQAASILYKKGATPRQIFEIINHTIIKYGPEYTEKEIFVSANKFRASSDMDSIAYSSLSAINLTAFEDYFPWTENSLNYEYPWYLEGIIDKNSGKIDEVKLSQKIKELSKYAKF